MTGAGVVAQARSWANDLILRETRGPGDLANAMRRIEARHGLAPNILWKLRYRPPGDLFASIYFKLHEAYEAERQRQENLFNHERAITRRAAGAAAPLVRAADFVAGEDVRS